MLWKLIEAIQQADLWTVIGIVLSSAILLLICMPVHECAHAFAAYKLGDDTAKYQGRLSLRPSHHLDLIGSIMILTVGVGYAKPVSVNPLNLKNRKRDMAIIAAAGPLSNLLMGVIFTFLYVLTEHIFLPVILKDAAHYSVLNSNSSAVVLLNLYTILMMAFSYAAIINVSLAVFNLIPIPPFDGSRILGLILPDRIYWKIMQYERIIFIVVLVLLVGGFLSGPIAYLQDSVFKGIYWLVSLPFNAFA